MSGPERDPLGFSIISCQQCRSRKIKCSRHVPVCQACEKRNYICEYPQTNRKTSTRSRRKKRHGERRYHGFTSINKMLCEMGKRPAFEDGEIDSENASMDQKGVYSPAHNALIADSSKVLSKIKLVKESISAPLFSELVDFEYVELRFSSAQLTNYPDLLLLYSLLILSERFTAEMDDVIGLEAEYRTLVDRCIDCEEKVASLVIMADYYHFNLMIEDAWKSIFSATSISYALGLHEKRSKIWTILVLYDSLICSIVGRPTSIHYVDTGVVSKLCNNLGKIAILVRRSNEAIFKFKLDGCFESLIALDMEYDTNIRLLREDIECMNTEADIRSRLFEYLKLLILTGNRIKLLFPGYTSHKMLRSQFHENCNDVARCVSEIFVLLQSSGLAGPRTQFSMRSQFFPAYSCSFQGILLQFIAMSTELLPKEISTHRVTSHQKAVATSTLDSCNEIFALIDKYEACTGSVTLCEFMIDILRSFNIFRSGKRFADPIAISRRDIMVGGAVDTEQSIPNNSSSIETEEDVLEDITKEIPDWISGCITAENFFYRQYAADQDESS